MPSARSWNVSVRLRTEIVGGGGDGWLADSSGGRSMVEAVGKNADLPASREWPLERSPLLLETSMPAVFAAGDVRSGSGKRVASAVGEGAVAIQLLHRLFAAEPQETPDQSVGTARRGGGR